MKYFKEFTRHFSSKPAFTSTEVEMYLKRRNSSKGYHKLLLHNLAKSGKIFRITRGFYTFYNEIEYVGFAYFPFYYGLEEALSLYGLWNQATNPVVVTPRMIRNGIRQFGGRNYIVRRIDRKMFFGYSYQRYENFYIPVSRLEKTLIDLLYYQVKIPDDVIELLIEKTDRTTLKEYLEDVPERLRKRVQSLIKGRS